MRNKVGLIKVYQKQDAHNEFIASLAPPNKAILLGINDIKNEGDFINNDGSPLTWTNWASNEPNDKNPGAEVGFILMIFQLKMFEGFK